ncbi:MULTISPECIES: SDR family oxidoreductase [unclassified Chryseobacterium]|uniref:SDR family oxidoreductase n=1 Tax=unclassified Chryseobacterium TaxID=2593645 RepID=UPI000D36A31F|nr:MULTISPECIES: SDR family oxidoreductase [unclassified Chryseobacterium]PTT78337.1 short-chain dehydrogenase/reductase [Chryseobacterium sp. HMWF001]PVV50398.1 SDR family NAD(P)-dependent oxidoreductase [Chryseobacterium sp. HMWF035]
MSKTIFITGASTGLGKATAKLFAEKGWNVVATMRTPENDTELSSIPNIKVMKLDVTNSQEIKQVAEKVIQDGVDVVFNNAGYGLMGPLEGLSEEQISRQLETNLWGVIRTTQAFIPYFREHKKGLFLTTTSIGGHVAFPLASLYHATKWALEGWSESMAFELNPFGITIKTIAPGGISTDFASRSLDMGAHPAYQEMTEKVWEVFRDPNRIFQYSTPEQIAEVVYEAATDGKNQLRYFAGEDSKQTIALRRQVGDQVFFEENKKRFFEN